MFSGQDESKTCIDCKTQFVFSIKDQAFYVEMSFSSPPKRCRTCRAAKKNARGDNTTAPDAPTPVTTVRTRPQFQQRPEPQPVVYYYEQSESGDRGDKNDGRRSRNGRRP